MFRLAKILAYAFKVFREPPERFEFGVEGAIIQAEQSAPFRLFREFFRLAPECNEIVEATRRLGFRI